MSVGSKARSGWAGLGVRTRSRALRGAAALAVAPLALLAASCTGAGHSATGPPVARLPGHHARTSSTGPPTAAQSDAAFVDFTRCMRAHGVQMSDPFHRPGHQGLSIDLPTPSAADHGAYEACNHFLAKVEQAKDAGGTASLSPGALRALSNYANCMRRHDIAMLDPTQSGQLDLGTVPGINSDFGRYSPQFRAADRDCRHLLPSGTRDDGTGP